MHHETHPRQTTDYHAPSRARFVWSAWVLPPILAMLCYANTLPNDYCFDDVLIVRDNPRVTEPGTWLAVLTEDHWAHRAQGWPNRDLLYRPVSLASYRLVHALCGPKPWPQHLMNVLLHASVCALVVGVARVLGVRHGAAPAAGCIFAVLPIHVEAVASIVGRADLLATVGVLGAVLAHHAAYCRAASHAQSIQGEAGSWRRATSEAPFEARVWPTVGWRVVEFLCAVVAMGAKESGLAVVPVLLLYDAFLWWGRGGDGVRLWHRGLTGRLAVMLVPLALYGVMRFYALDGQWVQQPPQTRTVNVLVDAPPWQHVLGVVQLWGMYWAKSMWPAVLTIKYSINEIRLATGLFDAHVLIGLVVTAVIAAVVLRAWRRGRRAPAFVALALILTYLPTSNAVVLIQVFFAERIWYMPSVWMCLLPATMIASGLFNRTAFVVVTLVTVAMLGRSMVRNTEWRDNDVLYAAAYRDAPHSVAALQLYGDRLVQRGELRQGIELLRRAVEMDLGFTDAQRSLGRAYLEQGDLASAVKHLQIASMQAPGHGPTAALIAEASAKLAAQRQPALEPLRVAAERAPYRIEAATRWITALREAGRLDTALAYLQEHDAHFREQAVWHYEYAVTLVLRDRVDDAIERYRRAIELDPDRLQWLVEAAMLLLESGRTAQAETLAARAASLAPDAPRVLACRAEIAVLHGDPVEAVRLLEKAVGALPTGHPTRRVFVERARALGARDVEP